MVAAAHTGGARTTVIKRKIAGVVICINDHCTRVMSSIGERIVVAVKSKYVNMNFGPYNQSPLLACHCCWLCGCI